MDNRLTVVPLEAWHLYGVSVNSNQKNYVNILEGLPSFPEGWAAFFEDELIVIGGAVGLNEKIGGWLLFTDKITPKSFIHIHYLLKGIIESHKEQGIPLVVHTDPNYEQAVRWAKLLGFKTIGTEDIQGKLMQRHEIWA